MRHFSLFFFLPLFVLSCTKETEKSPVECSLDWGDAQKKESKGCDFTSGSKGEPFQIQFSLPYWNPKKQNLYINFRVRKAKNLEGIKFVFSSKSKATYSYEIPLFKDTYFNLVQDDFETQLSFPLSALKKEILKPLGDIDQVKIYVKTAKGSSVEIKISDYQFKVKKKSKGFTTITFDDGYISNYRAAQIMKGKDYVGTAYLIPDAISKPKYLDDKQIEQMKKMGWDISSHHQTPVTEFYPDTLKELFTKTIDRLLKISSKNAPLHFAYPLGKHNKKTIETVRSTFKSARLASGGIETLPVADPHRLRVINVLDKTSPKELASYSKQAQQNGDWVIFMFHFIGQPEMGELNYSEENFKKFIEFLHNDEITVKKITEVL